MPYSVVKPHCSKFCVITAFFSHVQIFCLFHGIDASINFKGSLILLPVLKLTIQDKDTNQRMILKYRTQMGNLQVSSQNSMRQFGKDCEAQINL